MICPKCQHERSASDDPLVPDYQCPACGVIYAKANRPPPQINHNHFDDHHEQQIGLSRYAQVIGVATVLVVGIIGGSIYIHQYESPEENRQKAIQAQQVADSERKRIENDENEAKQKALRQAAERKRRAEAIIASSPTTAPPLPVIQHRQMPVEQPRTASNPMCVFDKVTTATDLKKYLANKYPDSYHLQETLFDGNMQALDQLCRNQSVMEPYQVNLIDGLIKRYYPSFHLIKTLYDGNVESYNKLHNQ